MSYNIRGLTKEENALVDHLYQKIMKHSGPNRRRRQYYDADYVLRNLGIAVPPEFRDLYSLLGWPKKGIKTLSNRIQFAGVVSSGDSNPYGLQDIFTDNDMALESTLAVTSALKYGCSFLTVSQGRDELGEPPVLINNRSALTTSIVWNQRLRRPSAGLTVLSTDDSTQMNQFILYTDEFVVEATKTLTGAWDLRRTPNPTGRAPITVIRYSPDADEDRPLGRSFISRPLMGLVDHGARTMLRTELNAEYYASPGKYALNLAADAFLDDDDEPIPAIQMAMSSFPTFPAPERDDITGEQDPEVKVGQWQQASMEPHSKQLEMVAAQAASEMSLPISKLGIQLSQPESSEAMEVAMQDLIADAERAHVTMGAGFRDAAKIAYLIENNTNQLPDDLRSLQARFRNASTPTQASSADATVKLVGAGILPADSDVVLERLDFDSVDIDRLKADRRRAQAANRLQALTQTAQDRGAQIFSPETADTEASA